MFHTKARNVAYNKLLELLVAKHSKCHKSKMFVLIGGCSRSGKTTLCRRIREDLYNRGIESLLINLDNWLIDINDRTGNETVRERYNYESIAEDIKRVQKGDAIHPPLYDPQTRSIICESRPNPIIIRNGCIGIVDGAIALDIEELRNIADLKIFVSVEDNLRVDRLMKFYLEYKGCSLEETIAIIKDREKEEIPIISATKRFADVIYCSQ